ncbi:ataxin-10 [Topomyia yanbarensis]|uniref:ataxin-10 n=1 Tax=Topomyia yanbarensis TaxID=2498891 RepID=UPI00273AA518|nr:ataxin-10 [Topomyia yanbarensis]
MSNVETHLMDENFEAVLGGLDKLDIRATNYDDFKSQSDDILRVFLTSHKSVDDSQIEIALKCLKLLKQSCALGQSFQDEIMSKENLLGKLKSILHDESIGENIRISCLQLAANLCVQNKSNQEAVLNELKQFLVENIESNSNFANASTMLVYNAFISKADASLDAQHLLEILLTNLETVRLAQKDPPEFVGIFMEYLTCKTAELINGYEKINAEQRIQFLRYLTEYIRFDDRRNPPINKELFHYLMLDFNKKCDLLLKLDDKSIDLDNSEELFTLLMLLSDATCLYPYNQFLQLYKTVFLNIGYLLRQLHELGQSENSNMFTPVQNIEEILKVKQGSSSIKIEEDISFSLKSSLVKALANLLYQNKNNQDLARETGFIKVILECTNLDARNPLIKEWTILAIRNLCENNLENQKFIASLSKVGEAENTLLTEYTAEGGTIRITPRPSSSFRK